MIKKYNCIPNGCHMSFVSVVSFAPKFTFILRKASGKKVNLKSSKSIGLHRICESATLVWPGVNSLLEPLEFIHVSFTL